MIDQHKIGEGVPIVGISFGPDGGLYGADWGGGYPLTQTGSIQRIDVVPDSLTLEERRDRESTKKWLAENLKTTDLNQLQTLLGHVDQRVRLRAQFEIVNRKEVAALLKMVGREHRQLARVHSIWGLGQLIHSGHAKAEGLRQYLSDPDPKIRMVTVRVLGEADDEHHDDFIELLRDDDLHVRVYAALALGRSSLPNAFEPLIELARRERLSNITTCATRSPLP